MVAVPTATPVTIPEVEPTVAIDEVLLVQLPDPPEFASVVITPVHTVIVPVLVAPGDAFTVNEAVTKHPLDE
jgi:hypothetical protein